MRADDLLELRIHSPQYGPKLVPTEHSAQIEAKFPNTLAKYKDHLDFVAEVVGDKGVAELEQIATAVFITKHEIRDGNIQKRAELLNSIKPHISLDQAQEAVREADRLLHRAAELSV